MLRIELPREKFGLYSAHTRKKNTRTFRFLETDEREISHTDVRTVEIKEALAGMLLCFDICHRMQMDGLK